MFRQNAHELCNLSEDEEELTYFLLYYQFFKNAFGLKFITPKEGGTRLRLYFDEFPETPEKARKFKGYIAALGESVDFRRASLILTEDNIAEVQSHNHVLLQALDLILGAISFRLNDQHLEKPIGQRIRGKRTLAKEKVYKAIVNRVHKIRPHFNFGDSTGCDGDLCNRWVHKYRHWRFISHGATYFEERTKAFKNKKSPQ